MKLRIKTKISSAIVSLLIWIGMGTVVYHNIENWNWVQSFYFSVTTLTTVGYGDLAPTTDLSRLFTSLYVIFGAAVVLTSIGIIGATLIERSRKGVKIRRKAK